MKQTETKVLLLTGYLGSGKTTLLNRILTNERGIRFAVIVNDIGEVNIDASLIQKGGIVGKKDAGDLVALQNGCICCTLKMDLVEQLAEIISAKSFDYIVIEASGICEPAPIAQTISTMRNMGPKYVSNGIPSLDCIVTVVDALRMQSEFAGGEKLTRKNLTEDDIENLIIEQVEFCNIILLNKISEVSRDEASRIKAIIRALQPKAKIIECDYCDIDLSEILNTGMFNFDKVATSAAWIDAIEGDHNDDDDHDEHEHEHHHHNEHDDDHGHHHHHHHGEGEVEEYGIQTYVYYRREPFDINRFDYFIHAKWPSNIIRAKGILYFRHNTDMSYIFEQAGSQKKLTEAGYWYATAPEDELRELMQQDPSILRDWDDKYGDRMIKLVFIGQNLDRKALEKELDCCLAK
ncbi:MAG: GTP-binding protein [Muribaculaceae bacterium]|jgi:G3E family GTPase|nr:GTP-binding protein [Muribaculaceae bacterium]